MSLDVTLRWVRVDAWHLLSIDFSSLTRCGSVAAHPAADQYQIKAWRSESPPRNEPTCETCLRSLTEGDV